MRGRSRTRPRATHLIAVLVAGLVGVTTLPPGPAVAAALPVGADATWQTDGLVSAVAYSADGETLYLGGSFHHLCPPAQATCDGMGGQDVAVDNLAALDTRTGAPLLSWRPQPNGEVRALALSASKVLYVGGAFTALAGQNHRKLAAVDATTGAPISAWKPVVSSVVKALALSPDGSVVYAGGVFTKADNLPRALLAAYTAYSTSAPVQRLLPWAPTPAGTNTYDKGSLMPATVNGLAVRPDGQVYAGGVFTSIGGLARENVAALSPATADDTGTAVPEFSLSPGLSYVTLNVTLTRDGTTLFANGRGPGGFAWGIDSTSGQRLWARKFDGDVQAAVATDTLVYVGGHFDYLPLAGTRLRDERHHLAALDTSTGKTDPWNPRVNSAYGVFGLAWGPGHVAAAGDFTQVQSAPHEGVAQFSGGDVVGPAAVTDLTTTSTSKGRVDLRWSASADGDSSDLTYRVYRRPAGGTFAVVDSVAGPSAAAAAGAGALAWTDLTGTTGATYQYRVRAADRVFLSPAGNDSPLVTVAGDQYPPGPPQGLTAVAPTPGNVDLTWTGPGDADDSSLTYTVRRTRGTTTSVVGTVSAAASGPLTFRDSPTATGTYTYTVDASDGTSTSAPSAPTAPVDVVKDSTVPTVPSGVTAQSLTATTVRLSWVASTDPEQGSAGLSYVVYRKPNGQSGTGTAVATTPLGQTTYLDTAGTGLAPDKSYTYYVAAKDGPNTSAKSGGVAAVVSSLIAADDFTSLAGWALPAANGGVTLDPVGGHDAPGAARLVGSTSPKLYGNARKALGAGYSSACVSAWVSVTAYDTRNNAMTTLVRLLSTAGSDIGRVYLDRKGALWLRSDWASSPTSTSVVVPADGSWHQVQLCVSDQTKAGNDGTLTAWWDGTKYGPITQLDTSPDPLGFVDIGDYALAPYALEVDDVAIGTTPR